MGEVYLHWVYPKNNQPLMYLITKNNKYQTVRTFFTRRRGGGGGVRKFLISGKSAYSGTKESL